MRRENVGAERICVGVITGARGLNGDIKVRSFTADAADIASYGPVEDDTGTRAFKLRVVSGDKDRLIARIDGIEDRTAAEALRGLHLYVTREALPVPAAEEYYYADSVSYTHPTLPTTILV